MYTVGKDNEKPETVRMQLMNDASEYLAEQYSKHHYPKPYRKRVTVGGRRIEVLVHEQEKTEPIKISDEAKGTE